MSEITLKDCQNVLLDLLKLADEVCRKYHIEYWIDGGTLLGTARNNSFIPWDDDIDICFLPDDYKRFISVIKKEVIPSNKHIVLYNDCRPFQHYSEYLADIRYLRNGSYPLKIDILMVKSLPDAPDEVIKDKSMVNFVHFFKFFKFKNTDQVLDSDINRFLFNSESFFIREKYIDCLMNYASQLNSKNESNLYSYIYNDMYVQKNRSYYNYNDIFPLQDISFEGLTVKAPNDLENYLTKLYGANYMEPPPKSKQVPFADKITTSKVSRKWRKKILYALYYLKSIKNAWKVKKAINHLN